MVCLKSMELNSLANLHEKKSIESQFTGFPKQKIDLKEAIQFYQGEEVNLLLNMEYIDKFKNQVGSFSYRSPIISNDCCNDNVLGEVYLGDTSRSPNVILVHGWRMSSTERLKKMFHNKMSELRWNMYYFPLPYHLNRMPKHSLYSGEFMISANIERTIQAIRQAILDLRALIQWIRSNKSGEIILIGLSLGGMVTNLIATVEKEIDMLVSIFYGNELSHSIWNTEVGKFIKRDLQKHGVKYEELKGFWNILNPSNFTPKINLDNILLLSAVSDQYIDLKDADFLWESWGKPFRKLYDCGHTGMVFKRELLAQDIIQFILKRLNTFPSYSEKL